uniref:Uncharacterized protein n=1 Tax=Avena sativa TaxID=4498 RepID=A0ACD5XZ32_AVESA
MAETSREREGILARPATLPDDLLLEILARVPYRSLCRFRCVSPSWRALCSERGILRRSPQALSGFFCYTDDDLWDARFLNFPGGSGGRRPLVDPSLPFLRGAGYVHDFVLVDCCGGLLLCKFFTSPTPSSQLDNDYVVYNPATEEWTVLPRNEGLDPRNVIRLGFDPAAPSWFAVFVLLQDLDNDCELTGVEIYSSRTGLWTSRQTAGWSQQGTALEYHQDSVSVFLDGSLHLATDRSSIITVDMDGESLREFRRPYSGPGYIGQSQGRLHAIQIVQRNDDDDDDCCLLMVWVLQDYATGHWNLKHAANILELLGRQICKQVEEVYTLIAIHPERDLIFFIDEVEERLMSYDIDSQKLHVVYNKGEYYLLPYHPYTPCFAEWLPTR